MNVEDFWEGHQGVLQICLACTIAWRMLLKQLCFPGWKGHCVSLEYFWRCFCGLLDLKINYDQHTLKWWQDFFFLRAYKAIRYFPIGEPVRTTDKLWKSPSVFQDYFFGVSSKSWASTCLSVHLSYAVYRAYHFLNWETKTPGTFLVFSP